MEFQDLGLNKQLLDAVAAAGYTETTPIQEKAIPVILGGQDVLGIAQTGTGKTAAYLLPILYKIKYAQGVNPRAVIIAPTRELVIQIATQVAKLAINTDLRYLALYGGVGPKTQKEELAKGTDLIIATPGRLLELYLNGDLILKELKTLIIDEADKMMDMGFMPQIRKLLEVIPRKRQNLLFSATFPEKVEYLSEEFLEFPIRIEVAPQASTVDTVEQRVYEVPNFHTKLNLILHFMRDTDSFKRVIIFVKTRTDAENLSRFLERQKVGEIRAIHANKGQNTRINAMEAFRAGEVRILVATDVAARGLDITDVSHVINFDVPIVYEDYVHRIGRTGRAKRVGMAITLVHKADELHIARVENLIRQGIQRFPIPAEVKIEETKFEEEQNYLRAIDNQRKKADPNFQGAFHEKKNPVKVVAKKKAVEKKKTTPVASSNNRSGQKKRNTTGGGSVKVKNKAFDRGKKR